MSLTGTIRRPDNGSLGTEQEVIRHLSQAFPAVQFSYEAAEPAAVASVRKHMTFFLRLWLWLFGMKTRYPNYRGYFSAGKGGVEFYFAAGQTVHRVQATSYGMTVDLDDNFRRLSAATGWVVKYPRF